MWLAWRHEFGNGSDLIGNDPSREAFGQKRPTDDNSWPDRFFDQDLPSVSAGERRWGNPVSGSTPILAIA